MFEDREDAGLKLAKKLESLKGKDIVVLALVRGAVMMGRIIGNFLNVPWDILVVKKISAPFSKELAIGAIGPEKTFYWNKNIYKELNISEFEKEKLGEETEEERNLLEKRLGKGKSLDFKNKTVILVDDGVATGATVIAGAKFLRKKKAGKIILAVPVIAKDTISELNKYFDKIVALKKESNFQAVGQFYKYFPQVGDDEVLRILTI